MSYWLRIALFLPSAALVFTACGTKSQSLPHLGPVPAFELTREDGQPFSSAKSLQGNVWIADFIFTNCPGPCPRMTQHMKHLQDQTEGIDALKFVSITVDPERDSPEALKAYATRFKADPGRWYFLTGTQQALQHLSKDVFRLSDVAADLEHSTRFVLVDKLGRIRGYYATADASFMGRIIEDAKSLVKE